MPKREQGGSNARRDLLIQTLGIFAYKIGGIDLAREIAAERAARHFRRPSG